MSSSESNQGNQSDHKASRGCGGRVRELCNNSGVDMEIDTGA